MREPLKHVPDGTTSTLNLIMESRYRSFDNQARKAVLQSAVQRIQTKLARNDFSTQHVTQTELAQLKEEISLARMQIDALERQLTSNDKLNAVDK